jgi:hypothetical protein
MLKVNGKMALLTFALCVLAISVAFMSYYGQIYQPSPILNTNLKFWTLDPTQSITRPYLWQADIIKGPFDNVSLSKVDFHDHAALELKVDRNNQNNSLVWTTVHVRQDLRGQALAAIFRSTISLWVFPTFHYWYNPDNKNPENTFGIEINDGHNLLWYVFSDNPSQTFQLPHHRIVLVQTPLNTWSLRQVNILEEWQSAGYPRPESISFILILGTTWVHPGDWVGYFSDMSVDVAPLQTESLSLSAKEAILVLDAVVILAVTGVTILLQRCLSLTGSRARRKGE